jgi:hypothetical protein
MDQEAHGQDSNPNHRQALPDYANNQSLWTWDGEHKALGVVVVIFRQIDRMHKPKMNDAHEGAKESDGQRPERPINDLQ